MQAPVNIHSASPFPLVATAAAMVSHLPEVLSGLVAAASLFYYYLVISEKLAQRKAQRDQIKQSSRRVAEPILDERHPPDAPSL